MAFLAHLAFLIILGNSFVSCDEDPENETVTDDESLKEKKFLTPITPILNNTNNTEAMKKLKDLWVTQQKFFKEVERTTKELCEKTNQSVEEIGYLFEEIDPLLVRQVRVLTTLPWQNTDEMYEVLDDELIDQQRRSWEALGRCLTDQYEFPDNKEEEQKLRKLFDKAKNDLLKRRQEIISKVKSWEGSQSPT